MWLTVEHLWRVDRMLRALPATAQARASIAVTMASRDPSMFDFYHRPQCGPCETAGPCPGHALVCCGDKDISFSSYEPGLRVKPNRRLKTLSIGVRQAQWAPQQGSCPAY